jgi:hypothetical protein
MALPVKSSGDGRVTFPALDADDETWTLEEEIIAGGPGVAAGVTATVATFRRAVPAEFLFLLAKRYDVPPSHAIGAQELAEMVFLRRYQRDFARVAVLGTRWVETSGGRFYETGLELLHREAGVMRKLERIAVLDEIVFVISAEGRVEDFRAHAATVRRWMDDTTFAEAVRPLPVDASNETRTLADVNRRLLTVAARRASGRWGEGLELATMAHVEAVRVLGDDHPASLACLLARGELLAGIGRARPALDLLTEATRRGETVLGATDGLVIKSLVYRARAALDVNDVASAKISAADALARTRAAQPADLAPVDLAAALAVTGQVAMVEGRLADAEPPLREALALLTPKPPRGPATSPDAPSSDPVGAGPEPDLELWRVLHHLGRVLGQRGRANESEPLLNASLVGRRAALGAAHPETIESLATLGTLFTVMSRHDRAEPLRREALLRSRETFGEAHPAVADRLLEVAVTCDALGATKVVEPLLQEALRIREARFGADHPLTISARENLLALQAARLPDEPS